MFFGGEGLIPASIDLIARKRSTTKGNWAYGTGNDDATSTQSTAKDTF